jgi:hypothetical protein
MIALGLVKHVQLIHGQPGVYWLTRIGGQACGSSLKPLKEPVLQTFVHDLQLVGLANQLETTYPDITWITAREIMSQRLQGVTDRKVALQQMAAQIPDGILVREGRRFAVELELSLKADKRLQNIVTNYGKDILAGHYTAVLYYCGTKVIWERISQLAAQTAAADRFQFFLHQPEREED